MEKLRATDVHLDQATFSNWLDIQQWFELIFTGHFFSQK